MQIPRIGYVTISQRTVMLLVLASSEELSRAGRCVVRSTINRMSSLQEHTWVREDSGGMHVIDNSSVASLPDAGERLAWPCFPQFIVILQNHCAHEIAILEYFRGLQSQLHRKIFHYSYSFVVLLAEYKYRKHQPQPSGIVKNFLQLQLHDLIVCKFKM